MNYDSNTPYNKFSHRYTKTNTLMISFRIVGLYIWYIKDTFSSYYKDKHL